MTPSVCAKGASVAEILDGLDPPVLLQVLFERLYAGHYRGQVVLHFDAGVPKVVEFLSPQQVRLAGADRPVARRGT